MKELTAKKIQLTVAWLGPVGTLGFFLGWIILGHNDPPPDPAYTAQELVANYYLKYRSGIMFGMCIAAAFSMLYMPWTCLVSTVMWRREKVPLLSLMQLSGGVLTAWILSASPCIWVFCAEFSTSMSPEIIKAMHFVGWYVFNMTWMITTIQCFAFGIFVFLDQELPQLFPKWLGWIAICTGLTFAPLTFLPYFKTGPFAINGFWAFWAAVVMFGIFELNTTRFLIRNIGRDLKALQSGSSPSRPIAAGGTT